MAREFDPLRRTLLLFPAALATNAVAATVLPYERAAGQGAENVLQEEPLELHVARLQDAGLGAFVPGYLAERNTYRKTGSSFPLLGAVRRYIFSVAMGRMNKNAPELTDFINNWGTKKTQTQADAVDHIRGFVYGVNQKSDDPPSTRQRIETYGIKAPIGILACRNKPVEILNMIFGRHMIRTIPHEGATNASDPTRVYRGWAGLYETAIPSIGSSDARDAITAWEESTFTTLHELGHQVDDSLSDATRLADIQPYLSLDEAGMLYSSYQIKMQEAVDAWLEAPANEAAAWGFLEYVSGKPQQDYSLEDEITAEKNQSVAAATGLVYDPDDARSEEEIAVSYVHEIWKKRARGDYTGSESADVTDVCQSFFNSFYHSTLKTYLDDDFPITAHQKIRADLTKVRLTIMAGDPSLVNKPVNFLRAHLGVRPAASGVLLTQEQLTFQPEYDLVPSWGQYGIFRLDGSVRYGTEELILYETPPSLYGSQPESQTHHTLIGTNPGRKGKSGIILRISGLFSPRLEQSALAGIAAHAEDIRVQRLKKLNKVEEEDIDWDVMTRQEREPFRYRTTDGRVLIISIDRIRETPLHVGTENSSASSEYSVDLGYTVSPLVIRDGTRKLAWDRCRALVIQATGWLQPVCFAYPPGSSDIRSVAGLLVRGHGDDMLLVETRDGFRMMASADLTIASPSDGEQMMTFLWDRGLTVSQPGRLWQVLEGDAGYMPRLTIVPVRNRQRIEYQLLVTDNDDVTREVFLLQLNSSEDSPVGRTSS